MSPCLVVACLIWGAPTLPTQTLRYQREPLPRSLAVRPRSVTAGARGSHYGAMHIAETDTEAGESNVANDTVQPAPSGVGPSESW